MSHKPRLVVLSHVLPFPRNTGQKLRVFYTLQAIREAFHVTVVTTARNGEAQSLSEQLSEHSDASILLPSRYSRNRISKMWHQGASVLYALGRGLKRSNYVIGQLEFHPSRLAHVLGLHHFDCALFEYWHASQCAPVFRARGIPSLLDMHDILYQALGQRLEERAYLPKEWRRWTVNRYKAQEERAWEQFDGLIAINREEQAYVQSKINRGTKVFYAPMGTDLSLWPYSWEPSQPVRVAYYGGLGSSHNQQAALQCHHQIMPRIWERFPEAELWLVGTNPPDSIRALTADPRVKVPGFVEKLQPILRTMSVVLCPWSGTYGFRSRLIEVMALGVPLVASPDAVYGMELAGGRDLLLGQKDQELAQHALRLIEDDAFAAAQSCRARQKVEQLYSLQNTYGKLTEEVCQWLGERKNQPVV